jgi:hypothetical protein
MASEARLYTFSQDTQTHLRKFRLGTSRASEPQAVIYYIDKNTHEIRQDDDGTVYKTLDEVAEDLPDHSPRFVLLSYPLTLVGILSSPLHSFHSSFFLLSSPLLPLFFPPPHS